MPTDENTEAIPQKLNILFRDNALVAIDKPPGLLVHRSSIDAHETQFALQMLRDQIGQEVFPCHRLDKPTSGILLFALNKDALTKTREAFTKQSAKKTYHAVVRGWLDESGVIDYPLRKEDDPSKIQDAVTAYRCLKQSALKIPIGRYPSARFSLVELQPKTGRTHQLRRHMAHLRHPIIGDTRHGDGVQNRFLRTHYGRQMLLLRAVCLQVRHPNEMELFTIEAGSNKSFSTALEKLELKL